MNKKFLKQFGNNKNSKITFNKKSLVSVIIAILVIVGSSIGYNFFPDIFNGNISNDSHETIHYSSNFAFRNESTRDSHYKKHGKGMGFKSAKEYESAASAVVNNKKSLHKLEKEDDDDVYYLEKTNEFVIVSTDGYIRTYFKPDSGIKYYNSQ